MTTTATMDIPPLTLGPITLTSRLVVGTGKYRDYETMQASLNSSGCSAVTVAVRRERLLDEQGRSLLDFIDLDRYAILPNTADGLAMPRPLPMGLPAGMTHVAPASRNRLAMMGSSLL